MYIQTSTHFFRFAKGCGRQIVDAVVGATPKDWFLAVLMDWSGGFWNRMAQEYPRLSLC